MKKILVFLTLITLTACGAQTSDKILTNGYTDNEKLIESGLSVDEIGFDASYRTGMIEEIGEEYSYRANGTIRYGDRVKIKTFEQLTQTQKVFIANYCNVDTMTDEKRVILI